MLMKIAVWFGTVKCHWVTKIKFGCRQNWWITVEAQNLRSTLLIWYTIVLGLLHAPPFFWKLSPGQCTGIFLFTLNNQTLFRYLKPYDGMNTWKEENSRIICTRLRQYPHCKLWRLHERKRFASAVLEIQTLENWIASSFCLPGHRPRIQKYHLRHTWNKLHWMHIIIFNQIEITPNKLKFLTI